MTTNPFNRLHVLFAGPTAGKTTLEKNLREQGTQVIDTDNVMRNTPWWPYRSVRPDEGQGHWPAFGPYDGGIIGAVLRSLHADTHPGIMEVANTIRMQTFRTRDIVNALVLHEAARLATAPGGSDFVVSNLSGAGNMWLLQGATAGEPRWRTDLPPKDSDPVRGRIVSMVAGDEMARRWIARKTTPEPRTPQELATMAEGWIRSHTANRHFGPVQTDLRILGPGEYVQAKDTTTYDYAEPVPHLTDAYVDGALSKRTGDDRAFAYHAEQALRLCRARGFQHGTVLGSARVLSTAPGDIDVCVPSSMLNQMSRGLLRTSDTEIDAAGPGLSVHLGDIDGAHGRPVPVNAYVTAPEDWIYNELVYSVTTHHLNLNPALRRAWLAAKQDPNGPGKLWLYHHYGVFSNYLLSVKQLAALRIAMQYYL